MNNRNEPSNSCCVCDSYMLLVISVIVLVVALVASLLARVECPAEHEQIRSLNKDIGRLEKETKHLAQENKDFKKENLKLIRLCQEREIDTQVCLTKEYEEWQFWRLAIILAFVVGIGFAFVSKCCLSLCFYRRQTGNVVRY